MVTQDGFRFRLRQDDIAEVIGYDSEYSFKRAFVRTVGVTPRDYCAQNGGETAAT